MIGNQKFEFRISQIYKNSVKLSEHRDGDNGIWFLATFSPHTAHGLKRVNTVFGNIL